MPTIGDDYEEEENDGERIMTLDDFKRKALDQIEVTPFFNVLVKKQTSYVFEGQKGHVKRKKKMI